MKKTRKASISAANGPLASAPGAFYVAKGSADADVKAKYENGILELSIPKKEPQKVDNKKYIAIEG